MSEMNGSRTSLNAGGAGAYDGEHDPTESHLGFEQMKNPFTDPGDDEIFTFKDKERVRKERERM